MQALFLQKYIIDTIIQQYPTPLYVYSEDLLEQSIQQVLHMPHAFGLTVRYAMKANSNGNILRLFHQHGLHIDASSSYEVMRALAAGIPGTHIQLSGQELPTDLAIIKKQGIQFVATSLHQLTCYGEIYPHTSIGIRINPGKGSAAFKKINTGGPAASFGIWHDYLAEVQVIAKKYQLTINKIHIHIGSENSAQARSDTAINAIKYLQQFPDVTTLNMGGGFKIAIMPYEKTADLNVIGNAVKQQLEMFYQISGRKIHLEIEPGKFLVMNSCILIAKVIDIVDTGPDGFTFIKLNAGMTELPRTALYGVQQPIHIITENQIKKDYVVVGHCCESSDLLTCALYQSNVIEAVSLPTTNIGDIALIQSCGAYNAAMSMKNYNSYPEATELLLKTDGTIGEMRKRQTIEDMRKNEINIIN